MEAVSEVIELVQSSKGHNMALHSGHQYYFKRVNKNGTINWSCVHRSKCGGSLTTSNNNVVRKNKEHDCIPDKAKAEVLKCLEKCKKRAREELLPIPRIFNQEFSVLKDAGMDFVTEVPSFENKKSTLYRKRNEAMGFTSFSNRRGIKIPETLGEDFLFIDDGDGENRILAFCSKYGRQCLKESTDFFADGTFKCCSKLFSQLYSIHVDLGSTLEATNIVPVVYAFMPDRKLSTYERLFKCIKLKIPEWQPRSFKTDFEIGAMQAFRNIFESATLTGCNIHFNQSLWRKVQELGM